ncbi:LysR family transcriptional regulator [Achromobacter spanius]|uniref:LysR family transcriptional regulator n=1 Tax=Achromobacter spanius TaxID=217203 RepID=UPI0036EEF94A
MTEMNDRFDGINAFVATAHAGGFSAAARELGMTPSGVAKSVARLEARIGLKLLHRTTRKVSLTPEGEAYLDACLGVIEQLDLTESGLSPKGAAPKGRVRLQLPGAFGRRHVLPGLLDMARRYQKLDLSVSFSERTVDLVQEGYDLAVRIGDVGDDSNLVAKRLGTQRLVICAAPAYIDSHGPLSSPEALLQSDCITGPRGRQKPAWLLRVSEHRVLRQEIKARHEFSDGEAMLAAGLAGCGVMQMPTWLVANALQEGRLVPLLEQWAGGEMPIHAVWPQSRFMQPRLRAVIDMLTVLAEKPGSGFNS